MYFQPGKKGRGIDFLIIFLDKVQKKSGANKNFASLQLLSNIEMNPPCQLWFISFKKELTQYIFVIGLMGEGLWNFGK